MRLPFLLLGIAAVAVPAAAERMVRPLALADLVNADGSPAGKARIIPRPNGVMLEVEVRGMKPGPHALHLHAVGKCQRSDDFTSAGGHLNPEGHEHGNLNPKGSHLGDLPNVTAGSDGKITAGIRTPMRPFKLMQQIFDDDGTAIVVHEDADDYRTDPTGNAGKRMVCGVFYRPGT